MKTVNVFVRWMAKGGWYYTVYELDQKASETASTSQSQESGPVSSLVAGIDSNLQALTDADRQAIKAAAEKRWPNVKVEFGPVPTNANAPRA